ncbi:23S rRNA (pseudouridine(1915)-N(3))-methyltransferase RlmH [Brevibacillus sp. HB1.4B]|uniref:23S rRNA (pseudouridine(1915)-N(3))-methyltransferase RlmH n=1 Tax=Brevibacillus TaxID=55080 RepID=UPI00156BC156|nr:23S rRNA (pseudouridine(1915)-N(3))-methyltransferase RlmH [Brevibacillus sp. HB1.4B]NRS19666.1 23S rRNA (pseudouridine(1915)-N(3))-methyltransferase RlmH [Brevibacillus sp. HB1.4B]
MQFTIISVGKIKNDILPRVEAYSKRLAVYCRMDIVEIPEEARMETMSSAEIEQVRQSEGQKILAQVKQEQHVIALTGEGELWTPKRLSVQIEDLSMEGRKEILFVIGGSLGLSEEVLVRANDRLALPKKAYPHQLTRLVVLERLYRALRISLGEPMR